MRWMTSGLTVLVLSILVPTAHAQTPGEVWVTLVGNDFAKPYYEGDEYSDHYHENMGKKLVIQLEDYQTVYEFELRPSLPDYEPFRFETDPKKFRPTRVRGERLRRMVMKITAHFKKKAAAPPPAPKPEPGNAPAPANPAKKPGDKPEKSH